MKHALLLLAGCAAVVLATRWAVIHAQEAPGKGFPVARNVPYTGSTFDALAASASGTTIPLSTFTFVAAKDGDTYTDVIVGRSPFSRGRTTTTIQVLIIPVIVTIGSITFDPMAVDACIPGATTTPLAALENSPIFRAVAFDGAGGIGHGATMNGVDVGTTTYPDAFRRAEFWSLLGGTSYHTRYDVTNLPPWTISASTVNGLGGGNVLSTGCAPLGVLNNGNFDNYVRNTMIPGIASITPRVFPIFLMKDVVTTNSAALNCLNGCTIGYHGAFGSPVQTYSPLEYDTTSGFWNSPGIQDISVPIHEVGEWMDDPLVTNPTPLWGGIGQVGGCQGNWEVGDPLTGTDFPAITMPNGVTYHPQELTFWSWFYNAQVTPSVGAGGKFSSNGTFSGPSKPCPPGGTF
jgi:hypothetical protein